MLKFVTYNQKTVEAVENFQYSGSIGSPDIDQVINFEPRRFENDIGYTIIGTSFHNDRTISCNGAPSAPSSDQIGPQNDLGLPVYFPDIRTVQRTPNETTDDIPTFEQVKGS